MRSTSRPSAAPLERKGKLDGQLIGKTPWLQSVHIISPDLEIGDLVEIDVTQAGPNSLTGQIRERLAA